MTGIVIKIGNWETDTHTWKMPCEDKGRVQSDISINYKIPKIIGKRPRSEERGMTYILHHSIQKEPTS